MKNLILTVALALGAMCLASPAKAILPTDRLQSSTMTVTGPGFGTVVPAPASGSGLRISVAQYELSCTTNTVGGTKVAWAQTSNAAANVLTSTMTLLTSTIIETPYVPNGSVTPAAEKSLVLSVGTADTCGVNVYWFTTQQ